MTDLIEQLKSCRTCAEAQPILESVRAGKSARKLVETSINLRSTDDPANLRHAEEFLITAVQEMSAEKHGFGAHDEGHKPKSKGGIEGMKEAELTGGGGTGHTSGTEGSEQSSDNELPFTGEGKDAPNSDIESMQSASGKDQMGVAINEAFPPQQGGGGGMGQENPLGIPGVQQMCPDVAQQMAGQMPQLPPMNTNQQMQQTHYTISETQKPLIRALNAQAKQIKEMRQAIIAHEKRFQETESNRGSMAIDFSKVKKNAQARTIKETIPLIDSEGRVNPPVRSFPKAQLEDKRSKLTQINDALDRSPGIE